MTIGAGSFMTTPRTLPGRVGDQGLDQTRDVVARRLDVGRAAVLAQGVAGHGPDAGQPRAARCSAAPAAAKKKRTVEDEVKVT